MQKKNVINYFYKQLHYKCNGVYILSSVYSNKEKFYNLATKEFEVLSKKTSTTYKKWQFGSKNPDIRANFYAVVNLLFT